MVYKVKKGNHDFLPNFLPTPYCKTSIEYNIVFDESCWWSIDDEDYDGGNDIKDWNKLFGLSSFFSLNNSMSVMFAWRPSYERNIIEVAPYINNRDSTFILPDESSISKVEVGESIPVRIRWTRERGAMFDCGINRQINYNIVRPRLVRRIGPWFGGNQKAHRDMELYLIPYSNPYKLSWT